MKKIIIFSALLASLTVTSQTIIGINGTVGASKITNDFQTNLSPENVLGGSAFGLGANTNFLASKRFNPKVNVGFMKKNSTSIRNITYRGYDSWGNSTFITEDITTHTSINNLHLDLGVRFNILNKKNKLFVELSMNNNYILSIKNYRPASGMGPATRYDTKPTISYYAAFLGGIGYNYSDVIAFAIIYNPALSYYDSLNQSRVNMWGLNVCYYLPVLGNSKAKKAESTK
jgi:hypothetical protein